MTTTTYPIPAFAPMSGNAGVTSDVVAAGPAGRCGAVAGWDVTGVVGRYGVSTGSGIAGPKGRGRASGHPNPIPSNFDGTAVRAA